MDARQQKGLVLAKDKRIKQIVGSTWAVPSQSTDTAYLVNAGAGTCTCPDYELRKGKCKHLWAVEIVKTVETQADGTTVTTESIKVTRKTYVQDWPAYNAAQCAEKETARVLLRSLCDGIESPMHTNRGPKPIPLSDVVFGLVSKVYATVSGRRATTEIKACEAAGQIRRAPAYNTLFTHLGRPEMTAILTRLIEQSAAPLASIETDFAVDSTGFGTSVYRRWFDAKYGREMKESTWVKAHVACGTLTNVVTAVRVTDSGGADCPQLPALLATTAQTFTVSEMSADKAYLSNDNLTAIEAVGAVPFIPFKTNSKQAGSPAWRRITRCSPCGRRSFWRPITSVPESRASSAP